MDPLSISASIAGLVSLADLVFRQTKKYVKSARGSYKEVNDLYREVQGLSNVLHKLSLVAFDLELEATEGATIPFETAIDPSCIRECDLLLGRLRKGLSDTKSDLGSSSAFNRLQALLKWPFSSTETRELLDDVRRQKQVIDTAIAADSLGKMRSILSNQEKISAEMSDIQTAAQQILDNQAQVFADKQKKAVFDFFSKIDHRAEFEKNKRLRHSQTSLWLTQGQDFDEWYSTPGGRMWCSGIPGAGKSVIAVSVIEECLRRREVYKDTAVAYVFCTYRDASTYELSAILSSLCAQLALHNEQALEVLSNYHEELKKGSCSASQPSTDGLVRVVHEMSSFFSSVYLVIDGLDECGDHLATNVRSLTGISLSQREKLINLAILSRDELIIRQSLEPMFHHIEIAAQPEDIQLYVASQLEERIKTMNLKFRNLELKDQIMTELVDGAQGMFRWVACQLDHICNLPSDRARRYALGKLPPTLPATYERILTELDKLNDEAKQLVQRTLLLISLPPLRQLTFDELCEAISVDLDSDTLVDDDLVEKEEVLRWCGSLVRQSVESRTVEFSHFTVQKYLEEDCPKHPTIHQYGVSKDKAYALLGSLCLRYLTLKAPNYQLLPESAKAAESEHPSIMDNLRPSFISPSARHRAAQILVRAGAKHDLQLETPFISYNLACP
ncbi:Vegetative incompatibility protein HET-E-1 [Colletotrichum orbiculare MAFF 240422]|uniref:Vegetative incompatibility protein HET-E-1 n=1 Tax=Colletotrichum orbiculare (strain 104-T / ATCC 96160 / CBS 514.97 / LARS 414 / MAFF 240422) TaxID=1213857 RepID=A0A484G3S5_COLOR|nr:Vegetative incompatibility protein HET-E-1 [Colletotrichum orbiculare MAFF 240422]